MTISAKSKTVAGLVGLTIVALPLLGALLSGDESAAPVAKAKAASTGAAPERVQRGETLEAASVTKRDVDALAAGELSWREGARANYRLSLHHGFAAGHDESLTALAELDGYGTLQTTCFEVLETGFVLGQRLSLTLTQKGMKPGRFGALQTALTQGVDALVEVDRRGRVQRVALPSEATSEARNLIRNLVASNRFALSGAPANAWEAKGWDAAGESTDRYAVQSVDGPVASVERHRTFAPGADKRPTPTVAGALTATLRSDGRLLSLGGEEQWTIAMGGNSIRYVQRPRLRLQSEDSLDAAAARAAYARLQTELVWEDSPRTEAAGEQEAEAPQSIRDLSAIIRDRADGKDSAFLEVLALLRAKPESASEVLAAIQDLNNSFDVRRSLVDALGGVESAEAQQALLALAKDDSLEERLVPNVFLSLGERGNALPEVQGFLLTQVSEGETNERWNWAAQATGLLAARATTPEEGEAAAHVLELQLGKRGRHADTVLLGALRNGGKTRSFEAIMVQVESKDVQIRAAAVSALEHLHADEVTALVAERATNDADPVVREAALRTIAARGVEIALPVLTTALNDEDTTTRLQAVSILGTWLAGQDEVELDETERAAVIAVLQKAQRGDDDEVRRAAAQLLS